MTSFVGAFPMSDPQYIVLIMIDRPQAVKGTYGFNAAGWNAAPVAGEIIGRIAPLLHLAPSMDHTVYPEANPFITSISSPQQRGH